MFNKLLKISYTVAAFILVLALSVSAVSVAEYLAPQLSSGENTFQAPTSLELVAPVPDTGQTACYNVAGDVITCPSPGEATHIRRDSFNLKYLR